ELAHVLRERAKHAASARLGTMKQRVGLGTVPALCHPMAPKTDTVESPTNHPVLVRRTVNANGASHCALRVFCGQQGRSVPVEECRRCRDCIGIVPGTDGIEQAVLCPPDPTNTAGGALRRGVIVLDPDVSLAHVVESLAGGHIMAVAVADHSG